MKRNRWIQRHQGWETIGLILAVVCGLLCGACTETKLVPIDKIVDSQQSSEGNSGTTPGPAGSPTPEKTPEAGAVPDIIPPLVATVNPVDNSKGAVPSTEISVTFNESIDPQTITGDTVQVSASAGDVLGGVLSYDPGTNVASFKPQNELLDGETYTVVVMSGIKDLAGNALQLPHITHFQVLHSDTVDIAAGQDHFLAVKENGSVWAWGRNNWGQLGDGTRIDRNRPVRVTGLENIKAVSAGISFSLALDADGNVWAWGRNQFGQLGSGSPDWSTTPTQIAALGGIKAIASGMEFSLALDADGNVWAWGRNQFGQLGDGTKSNHSTPAMITGLSHVIAIEAGGSFALAQTQSDPKDPSTRMLWAWGNNISGQLGVGNTTNIAIPTAVSSLSGGNLVEVKSFAAGSVHSLAVTDSGQLLGWGDNSRSQAGGGGKVPTVLMDPATTKGPAFVSVGAGPTSTTSYAVDSNGAIWGWGANRHRQLMQINPTMAQATPTQIGTMYSPLKVLGANIASIQGGVTMILQSDHSIAMAGFNLNGQLGNGSASYYSYKPNYLPNVPPAVDISGRSFVNQAGNVWVWGRAADCEVGTSIMSWETMVPNNIQISDVKQISHGQYHILALKNDRTVWGWGRKIHGETGAGSNPCVPTQIMDSSGNALLADEVRAGYSISLALRKNADGTADVFAWGDNSTGHLGIGTTDSYSDKHPTATKVPGLPSNVTSIYSWRHDAAVTADGQLYLWGINGAGQLGDGTTTARTTPTLNPGITNAEQVVLGDSHTLVLLKDKTVVGMGNNLYGQLGNGTAISSSTPIPVSGLGNVISLVACNNASAAVSADTTMYTWGDNKFGALGQGVGNSIDYMTPAQIPDPNGAGSFRNVAQASCNANVFVVRLADGTIWEWGFSGAEPVFLLKDGESAISAFPVTVNWP